MKDYLLHAWSLVSATVGVLCTLFLIYLAVKFYFSPLMDLLASPAK